MAFIGAIGLLAVATSESDGPPALPSGPPAIVAGEGCTGWAPCSLYDQPVDGDVVRHVHYVR
jgi:hypothetical protein